MQLVPSCQPKMPSVSQQTGPILSMSSAVTVRMTGLPFAVSGTSEPPASSVTIGRFSPTMPSAPSFAIASLLGNAVLLGNEGSELIDTVELIQ